MLPLIAERQSDIAALCRRFGVRRLVVFGSAARHVDLVEPDAVRNPYMKASIERLREPVFEAPRRGSP